MTKKTNFKKHLLTSASALVMGAFAAQGAFAADVILNATGSNYDVLTGQDNFVDTVDVVMAANHTHDDAAGVILTSAKDFSTGAFTLTGVTVGITTEAGVDATATTGTILTIAAGGTVTSGTNTAVIVIDHAISAIVSNGAVTSVGTGSAYDLGATVTSGITVGSAGVVTSAGIGSGIITTAAISGSITNNGTITSATTGEAIQIGTGMFTGNITNNNILSTTGASALGVLDIDQIITGIVTNKGTISTAGAGVGVNIGANITGGFVNSGSINAATTGNAIIVSAAFTDTDDGFSNSGTINATGSTNGVIDINAAVGRFTNTKVIADLAAGDAIDVAGVITVFNNTGTTASISSLTGIALDVNSAITALTNSGTITSGGAITVDDDGGIAAFTNTGTVSQTAGNFAAIDVGAVTTSITNGSSSDATGVISATGTSGAVTISGAATGSITNYAIIKNTSTGAGEAIQIDATLTGGIDNKAGGLITTSGTAAAINNSGDFDITANITNAGTISSTNGTAAAINLASAAGKAISVTNTGAIIGTIALGTTDTITNSGTITGAISGTGGINTITMSGGTITGAISLAAGADVLNFNGGSIVGDIDLGGTGGDTINFGDAAGDSITYAGTIAYDDMVAKFGTTTLSGIFTGIAGSTITVDSGATLYVTANSTNLAASSVAGTLQIGSGKTLTAGTTTALAGTLKLDFTPVNTSADGTQAGTTIGKYASSGALTMAGSGNITINVIGTAYTKAQTIASIVTAGSLGGTYATGTKLSDNSYTLAFAQTTNGTNIDLTITRENTLQSAATGTNQSSLGSALEAIANNGDAGLDTVIGALDTYSSAGAVEAAMKTLAPTTQTSGATTQATVAVQDAAIGTVEGRMETARNEISGNGVATGSKMNNNGVWGEVFGSSLDQGVRKGVDGYQANLAGFSFGGDTAISNEARVGAAFAYGNTDAEGTRNEVKVDSYQASVYGTYDAGKVYYEGLGAFAYNSYDANRTLFDNSIAAGDFNGQQYSAKGTAGYKIDLQGGLKVTPFVSAQYTFLTQDSYTETGSNANLHVVSDDINIFKTGLGAKAAYPIVDGGVTYTPRLSAAWYYDLIGDESSSTSNFTSAAATTFISKGAEVAQSAFRLGAGLDVLAQDNVTVSLDYNWDTKQDFDGHTGQLKARFEF